MSFVRIRQDLEMYIEEADIIEHSENVEKYSVMIYDNLKNKPDYDCSLPTREVIGICGRYHDIGKYFFGKTYPTLLSKEKFNANDKDAIKQHTLMGQLLLMLTTNRNKSEEDEKLIKALMDAIYYHHELIDGSGYYGRKGDSIPFIAQLIAVADHYSAGIEKRIYSREKTTKEVLAELNEDTGLNRECVVALSLGLLNEEG